MSIESRKGLAFSLHPICWCVRRSAGRRSGEKRRHLDGGASGESFSSQLFKLGVTQFELVFLPVFTGLFYHPSFTEVKRVVESHFVSQIQD